MMRGRRGTEAPMDFAWERQDRDVYARDSPFRPPVSQPPFSVPRHEPGPSKFPGGFAGATGQSDWNPRTDPMPAPELPDISMDSVNLIPSPVKPAERPASPAQSSSSGSEKGALVPTRRSSHSSNQIKRRSRRATSAPTGEDSEDSAGSGVHRRPVSLANHYTMHLNAPGTATHISPFAPHLLLGYVRVFFNSVLVLGFLYIVILVVVTVRRDIQDKVETYTGANAAKIQQCASQYMANRCSEGTVPHMKQFCDEWEQCMQQDASVVGRARVAAETLAEVVNGFVEPITWKTLGFSVSTLFLIAMILNASASFMRPQASTEPQHQAPYAYPPPYAVMPPEWGRTWSEGEPGPRAIRAASEVPGRERRSASVRR